MSNSKSFSKSLLGAFIAFSVFFGSANAGFSSTRWDCCRNAPHLCPAQPCCEDCGPFGGVDLLYWTVEQSDLDYVAERETALTAVGPKKLHFVGYEWDLGFRATVGYRLGYDGWDGSLRYTYFHASAKDSTNTLGGGEVGVGNLLPILLHPDFDASGASVKASARVTTQFDVLDFTFSRPFCVSDTLIMSPLWGVRGLWLDQSYKASYGELVPPEAKAARAADEAGESTSAGTKDPLNFDFHNVKFDGQSSGVGLVVGVNSNVRICESFSVYGNVRGSILAGKTRFKHTQRFNDDDPIVNLKEEQNAPLATYELGVGGNWETLICEYCVLFDLGYEFTHVIPTSRNRRYTTSASPGVSTGALTQDTVFHGLRANASVYF